MTIGKIAQDACDAWLEQHRYFGDRSAMFDAIAQAVAAEVLTQCIKAVDERWVTNPNWFPGDAINDLEIK